MASSTWLARQSAAFRLIVATCWLAPDACRDRQEQTIRTVAGLGLDWDEYLHLAIQRHRTPALSWAALRRVESLALPEKISQRLQREARASQLEATRNLLLLAELLSAFNRAEIPVMPLKGPLLSQNLYGDPTLRQSRDLDLVCRPDNLQAAAELLERGGWLADAFSSGFLHQFTLRQKECYLRYEHHLVFSHRTGCTLELHWRELSEDSEECERRWLRSKVISWKERTYQCMEASDLVRYLCVHGERHAWFRVKWLGDIARLHASGAIDWSGCLRGSSSPGEQRALLATLATLVELFDFEPPQIDLAGLPAVPELLLERNRSALLAPIFPTSAIAQWVDFRSIHRFLAPQKSFKERLLEKGYRGQDYLLLSLPDRLFWAYYLLRPFLFFWRHFRREREHGITSPKSH